MARPTERLPSRPGSPSAYATRRRPQPRSRMIRTSQVVGERAHAWRAPSGLRGSSIHLHEPVPFAATRQLYHSAIIDAVSRLLVSCDLGQGSAIRTFDQNSERPPTVAVVVPVLNEETAIGAVVAAIPRDLAADVVVVDGGSRDRTAQVAQSAGARVVVERRRGYGRACGADRKS